MAGQSGRLGIGDEANVMTPTLVEELQDTGIQTVRHSKYSYSKHSYSK